MKKRALSLLLALVMAYVLLPVSARADTLDNGLTYKVYEDHVRITNCSSDALSIVIPAEIDGLPVTEIGNRAFDWCSKLLSISIPETVTSIGEYAFQNCESLLSLDIPDNATSIGEGCFFACRRLNSIVLPDGLTSIKTNTFNMCASLASVDIPETVTSIGEYAFDGCSSLTSIDIPDGVTSIGKYAFYMCSNLAHADLPENLTSIGDAAFYMCDMLSDVDIPDGVTSMGTSAFRSCKSLTSIDLPDNLTIIGDFAFASCTNLTSIDLPDNLVSIGKYAFQLCPNLTSITIPSGTAIIYSQAFSNCSKLTSIYFTGNAPWFDSNIFTRVTATAYYPSGNPTWTADMMQNYGGTITWVPYNADMPFTDVPAGIFYEAPVLWALENNVTTGATANTFNPGGSCLRAQVVTFLHRAAKNPEPTSTRNPFSDVKTTDYFYKPVLWAVEKNITNGTSANKFGSFDVCNRAAVVTFLWRAAGSPEPESFENPFSDVKPTDFFYKPVLWAIENGITNGVDATHFGPTTPCNRAQVVTFLYRAYT